MATTLMRRASVLSTANISFQHLNAGAVSITCFIELTNIRAADLGLLKRGLVELISKSWDQNPRRSETQPKSAQQVGI
jgi:hypothetical protein